MANHKELPRESLRNALRAAIQASSDADGCFKVEDVIEHFESNYLPAQTLVTLCARRNQLGEALLQAAIELDVAAEVTSEFLPAMSGIFKGSAEQKRTLVATTRGR